MSYQRPGYPLKYFKGFSEYYVYNSTEGHMEDYGVDYAENRSFVELIGKIIERETGDKKYAWKMVKTLAKKLGIEQELREKPLTEDEFFGEMEKLYGGKNDSKQQSIN